LHSLFAKFEYIFFIKYIFSPLQGYTKHQKAGKLEGNCMRITEIFKTESEAERRKAVTELLIKLESKKHKEAELMKQSRAG